MMDRPNPLDKPLRPSLSSTAFDFGFGHVSSAPPSPSLMTFEFDEPFPSPSPSDSHLSKDSTPTPPLLRRLAKNNLLNIRTTSLGDLNIHTHSPLRMSFSKRSLSGLRDRSLTQDESDSDRERGKMLSKSITRQRSGSSPSSGSAGSELPTPPIAPLETETEHEPSSSTTTIPQQTPYRGPSQPSSRNSSSEKEETHSRRLSHSLKPPRLLSLLAESNPAENELQSEAQFQRLLAAYNGLPIGRTKSSRTVSDRGRYPEEANVDNDDREDTPSEDEEGYSNTAVGSYTSASAPIPQPGGGIFDDMPMSEMFRNSPSGSVNGMDVDMPPPSTSNQAPLPVTASPVPWRRTPPPTSTGVSRPNKRKHEDRYDPYPSSSKRRAVSPSIAALRESLNHAIGPGNSGPYTSTTSAAIPIPRSPIVRSRDSTSNSLSISVASSPGNYLLRDREHSHTRSGSHSHAQSLSSIPLGLMSTMSSIGSFSRPISALNSPLSSSPQQRPVALLASPIIRPIPRMAGEKAQREVDGTGMAVSNLSLS